MPRLNVILVFRKPLPSTHSIEYLFHAIYQELAVRIAIRKYELPCFSLGLVRRLRNGFSLFRFRRGIVHITGDCYYAILGAWFSRRLLTIHDLSFLDRTSGIRRRVLKLFWVSLPIRFAHRVAVVSQTTRDCILKETGTNPDKIQVIPNFIDPIYRPVERSFNAACPRILQVGTTFNKNIERLARALKGIECTLVIIGRLSPLQLEALRATGIRYENKFAISLEALHQEYVSADLLTFVSTVEGFGMPILEAQATGLPVLTSNCSSMPEVAGGGALLVDPLDELDIRSGLHQLIHDPGKRQRTVETGYRNVKRFSKEAVAGAYLKLYQQILT